MLYGGTDSTENPSIHAEIWWHLDFAEKWSIETRGMIERSQQWNGASAWLSLLYRF